MEESKHKNRNIPKTGLKLRIYNFVEYIRRDFRAFINNQNRRERRTNFNDAISQAIISLLFPVRCEHLDSKGVTKEISFKDYLDSHLCLSGGHSTPRVVIAFFDKCLAEARGYYSRNEDIESIRKNSDGEFDLVTVECVSRAYSSLRDDMWVAVSKGAEKWEKQVMDLRGTVNSKNELSLEDIKPIRIWGDDDELRQFMALLTHAGILKCKNPNRSHAERRYEFPILFRDIASAS